MSSCDPTLRIHTDRGLQTYSFDPQCSGDSQPDGFAASTYFAIAIAIGNECVLFVLSLLAGYFTRRRRRRRTVGGLPLRTPHSNTSQGVHPVGAHLPSHAQSQSQSQSQQAFVSSDFNSPNFQAAPPYDPSKGPNDIPQYPPPAYAVASSDP
ncbi:hypothetical protein FISHEDRAFT_57641 [Fistulina hepatica ATCC 64428]|uniref:Uncharacterized protein n=1 Tax=Fistulina hepatica ATCC 64428 TaxID=1128425 RepID=A0A0D7AJ27_9AGAR|nr:hypothetical protein FISHEDRAFT_57641 [Fistulina hepatica ATCC 64428]